ncbi:hypothetical protein MMC18_001632 [Xylographa bjoerkii]|nr:hypothetical protein [Xylographa bjoerkii]
MDPLSAVASIMGVIGFASLALTSLNSLVEFCKEFSDSTTTDFLHDLQVTADILTEIQVLCEKAKKLGPALQIDYRVGSLSIQVDDCARDLGGWLHTASRIKKERGQNKFGIKLKFFNSFLVAISKSTRTSTRERLRCHQENMKTALSVFGRHINFANTASLHRVEDTVQNMSRRASNEAKTLSKHLLSLSNSVSNSTDSLQAQNSNISDKIDQVTNLLQQVLSSHSSLSSSHSSNNCLNVRDNPGGKPSVQHDDMNNEETSRALAFEYKHTIGYEGPVRQPTISVGHQSLEDHEPEFEALYRATKGLTDAIQQLYHPLIAEYISTNQAWNTMAIHMRLLDMEHSQSSWAPTYVTIARTKKVEEMRKAAASQLLSLRKSCFTEHLEDVLERLDSELEILPSDVEEWENITAKGLLSQSRLQLAAFDYPNRDEQQKDLLTRTNEWMLGVLNSFQYLNDLHRDIMASERRMHRMPNLDSSIFADQVQEFYNAIENGEGWRRVILKFWFLDSAAMSAQEYAASQFAGSDSEATLRIVGEDDSGGEIGQSNVMLDLPNVNNVNNQLRSSYPSFFSETEPIPGDQLHDAAPENSTYLKVLYPKQPSGKLQNYTHKVDIVFVHGLNPKSSPQHAEKTWTHENGTMWPKDLLPNEVDYSRIMLFAYNSNVAWDVSDAGIREHANTLLDLLQAERKDEARPDLTELKSIIGYLGGLALVSAKQNDRVYGAIREKPKALVFFGTPHRGGNGTTLGQIAANVAKFFTGHSRNDLIESLGKSSKFLAHLTADFAHQYEDYEFLSVVETRGLINAPIRTMQVVVDVASSIIGLPGHRERVVELDKDHRQICKFADTNDFKRISAHLKRIAETARLNSTSASSHPVVIAESTDLTPVRHETGGRDLIKSVVGTKRRYSQTDNELPLISSNLFSTMDFRGAEKLIGQSQLYHELEDFLQEDSCPALLLHGPAGSGKSYVAYHFASQCQDRYSVFWFSAESPDTLQDWANRASYRLDPCGYGEYFRNHQATFRDWLMDERNGRWIVVFDDAHLNTDLQDIVPQPVAWGKIIITSRRRDLKCHFPLTVTGIPPLSSAEGVSLFWSQCRWTSISESTEIDTKSSILPFVEDIRGRPLAIVLAASCVRSLKPSSAIEYLRILDKQHTPTSSHLEPKLSKWLSLAMDELSSTDSRDSKVLTLLAILNSKNISEQVLDALCASVLADRGAHERDFMRSTSFGRSARHLISYHLLRREKNPWNGYFALPTTVQEVLSSRLAKDKEYSLAVADTAASLLCAAYNAKNTSSFAEFRDFMAGIHPHCRTVCLTMTGLSYRSDAITRNFLAAMAVYCLAEAIHEGIERCIKQFWRTWIVQNGYPEPLSSTNVDDGSDELETVPVPLWLSQRHISNEEPRQIAPPDFSIYQAIYDILWKNLRDSITISLVGSAWQGIRDEIFQGVRANREFRTDAEVSAIIDFIDKGGCEGLISATVRCIHSDDFKDEVMDSLGVGVLDEIYKLIECAIGDTDIELPKDLLITTVSDALEFLMGTTFHETSGAFADVLSPLRSMISVLIDAAKSGSLDSFQNIVSFTVDQTAGTPIRNRAVSVARAFWEVLGAAQVWIAAAILNRVAFALLRGRASSPLHATSQPTQPPFQQLASLSSRCVELVREGFIACQIKSTPSWRLSTKIAMYWCLQATDSRAGWGAAVEVPSYEYRNQERWDEACILLGMTENLWPLS